MCPMTEHRDNGYYLDHTAQQSHLFLYQFLYAAKYLKLTKWQAEFREKNTCGVTTYSQVVIKALNTAFGQYLQITVLSDIILMPQDSDDRR